MMNVEELWKTVVADLEVSLPNSIARHWLSSSTASNLLLDEKNASLTLEVGTAYHVGFINAQLKQPILDALKRATQKDFVIHISVQHSKKKLVQDPVQAPEMPVQNIKPSPAQPQFQFHDATVKSAIQKAKLREDYTFDTFAVSTSNEMANAAAIAVSQNPGTAYNPLFLYGGVGVGKTHLMQAIGNNILRKDPHASILYTTGEQFTNEIVAAIQQKKTIAFKQKLRTYHVLMVDDIQFLAGKTTIQEEFFHTFNAILPAGGQIVLTSDRPPHEIALLEDRLKSRFEAGLIVDIQQPTFELRTAIILMKAKKLRLDIPMDLAQKIASEVESPRRIEGLLIKLHSEITLFKKPLTLELVSSLLGRTEKGSFPKNSIKPTEVVRVVANHFHVSSVALRGPSRMKNLVEARHIAMHILHNEMGLPLEEVGGIFGGRDHTSVLHASEKIKGLLSHDDLTRTNVNAIKTSLSFTSYPQ